jgi:hypothetical protein
MFEFTPHVTAIHGTLIAREAKRELEGFSNFVSAKFGRPSAQS